MIDSTRKMCKTVYNMLWGAHTPGFIQNFGVLCDFRTRNLTRGRILLESPTYIVLVPLFWLRIGTGEVCEGAIKSPFLQTDRQESCLHL